MSIDICLYQMAEVVTSKTTKSPPNRAKGIVSNHSNYQRSGKINTISNAHMDIRVGARYNHNTNATGQRSKLNPLTDNPVESHSREDNTIIAELNTGFSQQPLPRQASLSSDNTIIAYKASLDITDIVRAYNTRSYI